MTSARLRPDNQLTYSAPGVDFPGTPMNLSGCSGSQVSRRRCPAGGSVNAEAEGFALFAQTRESALQRTAWLLTGDWGLAEDLVQTALVRSWPRWELIRRRDDPEIYVRRVMLNTWATWRRRRWRGEQATGSVPESAAPGDVA